MGEDIRGWLVSPKPCLRVDFIQDGLSIFFFCLFLLCLLDFVVAFNHANFASYFFFSFLR